MKSKSSPQSHQASSFETPKKRISTSTESSKKHNAEDDLCTPKSKRRSSTKKFHRRRRSSESDEDKIDKKTEENIQQAALKNNLTEDAVKKILKKVVGNDHVLAIVKLKEEEMEKNNQANKTVDTDDEDHDVEHTPKITRSKAKVLNKKILPITSPSEPSEASILIQQELGSDDEDEEYEPENEDVPSDDEHNSSISDMDSQPSTPKTPYTAEEDTPTKYTNDGLFKIPRDRKDSSNSLNDQDYIIAKRTRSKVSLTTTSIETIESTFQPPDITPDMYDRDNEMDTEWLEFLNVLTKPMNQTIEDDDEFDPEYIAADQIPIDKEELREVNISQKELNDLVDELFSNLSDVDFDEINKYDNIPELFRTKRKTTRNDNTNESNRSDGTSDHDNSFQASTPISNKEKSAHNITTAATNADDSIISMLSDLSTTQSSLLNSNNQTPTLVPINVVNPFQGASIVNGVIQVPQYQQILIQIPTIDILKIQAQQQSDLNTSHTESGSGYSRSSSVLHSDSQFGDRCLISRTARYKHDLFQHLKTDLPVVVKFDDGVQGFTNHQRDILNQQLRMHVQFATQNFLQVYGNPGNNLWKQASVLKSFLTELDDVTHNTSINIQNLQPALNAINKWEEDLLQPDTTENKEYVEFLFDEYNKSQNALHAKSTYIPKFHDRMLNFVVDSAAFPYPHLLPKMPFRMDLREKTLISEFIPIEDYLIAFFLEKFHDEYFEERTRNRCQSRTKISLERICDRICLRMCSFRLSDSKKPVYRYVIRRKSKSEAYNPIQYYFKHNKAPPFKHHLIKIDVHNKVTPKDLPLAEFPPIWAEHVKKRQAIEHKKNREKQICSSKPIQKVSPRVRSKTVDSSTVVHSSSELNNSCNLSSTNKKQPKPIFIVKPRNCIDYSVPIQYEIVEVNSDAQCNESADINSNEHIGTRWKPDNNRKSSIDLEFSDRNTIKRSESRKQNKQDIERQSESPVNRNESCEEQVNATCENLTSKELVKKSKNSFKSAREVVKKYLQINRFGLKNILLRKLFRIVKCFKEKYFKFLHTNNKHLLAVYNSIQTFNVYWTFVEYNIKMASSMKRANKEAGEDLNRRSKSIEDVSVEHQETNNPCSNTSGNVVTKKNPKAQRSDNTRLMLLPETKEDINEKDLVYAQNFMDKVEETFMGENKSEKVTEFLHILQTFDQSSNKVEELYYKMEQLFLPDHPELADLFLTFLLPGQAAQLGKFMDHFLLTNMNNFINKLNIYFVKQPAQIRKIMTCLRDLSNEEDLKLEQIKAKVFPLLKGNPLLLEWFKQCLPSETSCDCPADEYESLSFHKAENMHQADEENDVYENVNQTEITPDPVENPCHIRYLNGRVYYGSRILLPAKLSFLVVTASDQNTINEVGRSEIIKREATSDNEIDNYRCVHSIKQYGDNKMKECQKNQLETADNSAGEDIDIEKPIEEQNCSDVTDDADVQLPEVCVQVDEKNLSNTAESPDNSYNTCDDLTLKAHGIRLNPTVHQSNVIKSEDLLCLLDPVDDVAEKCTEDLRNSPKKQTTRAQRKSPNSKKSTKRSPTNNKKTANIIAEDSHAIRTAKRLKRLIESDDIDEQDRLGKKPKMTKCPKSTDGSVGRKKKQSTSDETMSIGIEKTEPGTIIESPLPTNVTNTWSRDEDKLLLEQIKIGFTNEENFVRRLHEEKLPNRSYFEIYDRFKFLMDVIANL